MMRFVYCVVKREAYTALINLHITQVRCVDYSRAKVRIFWRQLLFPSPVKVALHVYSNS